MNPTSQPYNGGPDSAHPSTAGEGNPAHAGTHEALVSQSESGGDPGEFGIGILPNPKARYWQGRAAFWRNEAIARGYKITEEPGTPGDAWQRARELLAEEWKRDGHPAMAHALLNADLLSDKNPAIRAITRALSESAGRKAEPVVIEAVAAIQRNSDGDLFVDWLLEGGIDAMENGAVLLASAIDLTNDEGYGEVYTTPLPRAEGRRAAVDWRPPSEVPLTKLRTDQDVLIAVRRSHSPGKVWTYPATYANGYPLCSSRDPDTHESSGNCWKQAAADDDNDTADIYVTGFYDVKSTPDGEWDYEYEPALHPDDELVAWALIPQYADDLASPLSDGG